MKWLKEKKLVPFLFLLVAFMSSTFAADCSEIAQNLVTDWSLVVGIAAILSAVLVALVYMLGSALSNPQMVAWAKNEFWQVILAIVLFVVITSTLNLFCAIDVQGFFSTDSGTEFGVESGDFFSVAKLYTERLAHTSYSEFYSAREKLANLYQGATVSISSGSGFFGLSKATSHSPGTGNYSVMAPVNYAMNVLLISTLSSLFLSFLLSFIQNGLFEVLFPMGVVFRCIPTLRSFGGALMAISLGLFLFFPFMLVLNDAILPELGTFGSEGELQSAAYMFVATTFLPALNFVFLVALVRQLSMILGEEVDISRLGSMI